MHSSTSDATLGFTRALVFSTFALFASLWLEVVLCLLLLLVLFSDNVNDLALLFSFASLFVHKLVKIVLSIVFLLVTSLEFSDSICSFFLLDTYY